MSLVSLGLYMDEHVPTPITSGLHRRSVDVLCAQDDGMRGVADARLLDHARQLRRVLFTRDEDFLAIAVEHLRSGRPFGGVVYAHQLRVSPRQCIDDLELIAMASLPGEMDNRIVYLPLR